MTLPDLAKKVGVTEQAVRHWESGRSYPGKATAKVIEQTLDFRIDWTEGAHTAGDKASAAAMINPSDLDLLLLLCRLPADFKGVMQHLAGMHLKAVEGSRFVERDSTAPVDSFRERHNVESNRGERQTGGRTAPGRRTKRT